MTQFRIEKTTASGSTINLEDEREVNTQCLRICDDAWSYIDPLLDRESCLLEEASQTASQAAFEGNASETQLRTRQALDDKPPSCAETISHFQRRPYSRQKAFRIGEVIADGDSDQVVVTTLADLFEIQGASSKGNSAQLVGSMTGDDLRMLAEKRYISRFGAVVDNSNPAGASTTDLPSISEVQRNRHDDPSRAAYQEQSSRPKSKQTRPGAQEIRKRLSGGTID